MMKKVWLILLAVVLVFGLVMLGCSSDGGGDEKKKEGEEEGETEEGYVWVHDLSGLEITLVGNFQYGDGYQYNIDDAKMMNGHKIVTGDAFTLEIEFTGSRDLTTDEDELKLGFADSTEAASYWTTLTWDGGDGMETVEGKDLTVAKSGTFEFTAVADATSADVKANVLNVQFKSPTDKAASSNSGTYNPNPVTLTFTKFILKYKE
jgi:hypothetical protein